MSFDFESINVDYFVNEYLEQNQVRRWYETRSGHRFLGRKNLHLTTFTFDNGALEVLDTLICEGVELGITTGFLSHWTRESTGEPLQVSHTPVEIAHGVFLYHTFESSVNFRRLAGTNYAISFSMVYRSRHNHAKCRENGTHYVLENRVFNKTFEV